MSTYNPDYDVEQNMNRLMLAMPVLATVDLEGFLAVVSMAHTLGPFVDPTRYRDGIQRGDMDALAALCEALLPAMKVWRERVEPKHRDGLYNEDLEDG